MDFGSVRSLALGIEFDVLGLPATVTRPYPDDTPIATRVVWVLPATDGMPTGIELQRQEARRVMAIRLEDVPTVPRGTIVEAPEVGGADDQRWRVEGPDRVEADHVRVIVVPDPAPY